MIEILYYFFNPLSLIIIFAITFGKYNRLNFHHIFILTFLIFIYARGLEVYKNGMGGDEYIISIIIIPWLYLIVAGLIHNALRYNVEEFIEPFCKVDTLSFKVINKVSLLLIFLPFFYIMDIGINNIPILHAIKNPGDLFNTMQLRTKALNSNISTLFTYIYGYSRALFYPVICNFLLVGFLEKKVSKPLFFSVLVSAVFFSLASTAKAPFAFLLFSMLLTYYYYSKVKIYKILITTFVIVFIPALIYPLLVGISGVEGALYALEHLFRRITLVPTEVSAMYFDLYGSYFDYLGFTSNKFLAELSGGEHIQASQQVYNEYIQGAVEGGQMNVAYFAAFYSEWGSSGWIFGTVLVAAYISFLQKFFEKYGTSILGFAVYSICIVTYTQLMFTNFYSLLLGRGLLLMPLLFAFWKSYADQK